MKMTKLEEKLKKAKEATKILAHINTKDKNIALENIALKLQDNIDNIIEENNKDLDISKRKGLNNAMIERLTLNEKKINSIINDIRDIIELKDPIGQVIETINQPNGLIIDKIRVPLGVIAVIYESRPNVTIDISCLALKTGNVVVLKGGSEAINTNSILVKLMQDAIKDIMPIEVITFIEDTNREVVENLIKSTQFLDVVIPRGGKGLINFVCTNSLVPVIETGAGNCHLYIEKDADINMALDIAKNAKLSRPSVCNSIETILIDKEIAEQFLIKLKVIFKEVEVKGCKESLKYINGTLANSEDYYVEYNDYIINLKIVNSFEEALEHIDEHSTKHSESIVTENKEVAKKFLQIVDSACVYHNASTRFTDGGCFGFGAELGISTQKLHVRGPIGLNEMTSYKYKIYGKGQVRV